MFACTLAILGLAAPVPGSSTEKWKEYDANYRVLSHSDPVGPRALLWFSARSKESTEFFSLRLKPLKLTAEEARALLIDALGEDKLKREAAVEAMTLLDPRLALKLPEMFALAKTDVEAQRLVTVLDGSFRDHEFTRFSLRDDGDGKYALLRESLPGSPRQFNSVTTLETTVAGLSDWRWKRHRWALVALEHFNTPESRAVIAKMTEGHADASLTKFAKELVAKAKLK